MNKTVLLLLFFCNSLYSQQLSNIQPSGIHVDYYKSNLNDFRDKNKKSFFNLIEPEPIVFVGEEFVDWFGRSVSSAGDVNGDGYLDIIAMGQNWEGVKKAYIFYGGALMDNIADIKIVGQSRVSSAEDVNGDGYSDIIIGSSVYFGGSPMDTLADVVFPDLATSAGDVNGDGYADIMVGPNLYFGGTSMDIIVDVIFPNSGPPHYGGDVNDDGFYDIFVGANLFFGGSSIDTIADLILTDIGNSLSSAGDVNGDGYSDVIVGAESYSSYTGRAYIYFGGLSMDNIADVILTGETTNNFFGNSVSSAGDINGDGYADVIVGAFGFDNAIGRVYIYYGGAYMNNIADITLTGEFANWPYGNFFGGSVSSFSDGSGLIVGADGGASRYGKVFLYRFYTTEPVLISPVNNSAINPLTIDFKWTKFNSADYYVLDISTNSLFSNIIETDTVYIDTSKVISGFQKNTKYFWRVRAKDTSGVMINSLVSNFTTIPPITANIKLLFEGMYSTIYNQLPRMDSITVYLRETSPPFAISDSAKNKIDSNSFSNVFKFNNAIAGTYYFVVKHFNCLETWSKAGGENIIYDTTSYVYDFTTSISQAYGSNLKLKGSKYCLYSGDINNDGYINLTDLIPIKNDASNFTSGNYLVTDLTGDNIVDLTDVSLCYNNASNFISVIKP